MSHQRASESVDLVNDHDHVTDISENTDSEKVIRYSGENYLKGIPTRNEIVAENNEGLTEILNNILAERWEVPFMAVDFEGSSEKIGAKYHHVYGFMDLSSIVKKS